MFAVVWTRLVSIAIPLKPLQDYFMNTTSISVCLVCLSLSAMMGSQEKISGKETWSNYFSSGLVSNESVMVVFCVG